MAKEMALTQGMVVVVDDEDYEWLNQWKWYFKDGYAARNIRMEDGKRKTLRMHRVIMNTPDDMDTDHRDGNRLNNTKENLRICTKGQNSKNQRKSKSKSKVNNSTYKGVFPEKDNDRWFIQIVYDYKHFELHSFTNEIAAANAYNHYAKMFHGEFASLNDVEPINNWIDYKYRANLNSKHKGVFYNKRDNNWNVQRTIMGQKFKSRYFKTEQQAIDDFNRQILNAFGKDATQHLIGVICNE